MTELAIVHYRQFRHISQVCRINYHGQLCRRQWTNQDKLKMIQGRQCGAYVGAVEEMMCVVCVDVTEEA